MPTATTAVAELSLSSPPPPADEHNKLESFSLYRRQPQGRRSHARQIKLGPYLLLQTLGEGEFGKVKLGIHTETGQEVNYNKENEMRDGCSILTYQVYYYSLRLN